VNFVVVDLGSPTTSLQQAVTDSSSANWRRTPASTNADTDLKLNKPELSVEVERDKAADTRRPVETIGRTLETCSAVARSPASSRTASNTMCIVQVADVERSNPRDIRDIYVRGRTSMVPLANLVEVEETMAPRELNHFGQRRAVTISANLAPGYTLGEALQHGWTTRARRILPPGYSPVPTTTASRVSSRSPPVAAWR
jgi:multidrug efflux pump